MAGIKISSEVEESVWNDLRDVTEESHKNISGLLTEAIRDSLRRRCVRPIVLVHVQRSFSENEEFGRLLAEQPGPVLDSR
jgi:hypothetical protein